MSSNNSIIPLMTYNQFFEGKNHFWNWDLPKVKIDNNMEELIRRCASDYAKENPKENLILKDIYLSEGAKYFHLLFEIKYTDDTIVVYAYDIEKMKFMAKFYFSMA